MPVLPLLMLQEIMVALSCGRARIVVALGVDDENDDDDDDDVGVEYGDDVVTVAAAPRKRRETMPTDRRGDSMACDLAMKYS